MKTVFTISEVATICKVSPRTASKWFDSGRLRGYRIPGTQDRRVTREHLDRFLKEHGMPPVELDADKQHAVPGPDRELLTAEQARERFSPIYSIDEVLSHIDSICDQHQTAIFSRKRMSDDLRRQLQSLGYVVTGDGDAIEVSWEV